MLGRMNVYIHLMGVDFQIKDESWLLIGPEFVFAGLANRVIDETIAHHAPVHVAILNFRERSTARVWIGNPAA